MVARAQYIQLETTRASKQDANAGKLREEDLRQTLSALNEMRVEITKDMNERDARILTIIRKMKNQRSEAG